MKAAASTTPRAACEPVGIGPSAAATAADNHDSGVGAFLLAGSKVLKLAPGAMPATVSSLIAVLGRPVTASSQQSGNEAPGTVDNDRPTRWSAEGYLQSSTRKRQARCASGTISTPRTGSRAPRSTRKVSPDGAAWSTAVDNTANTEAAAFLERPFAAPLNARYVRLTVAGVVGKITPWTSIVEFRVLQ